MMIYHGFNNETSNHFLKVTVESSLAIIFSKQNISGKKCGFSRGG